MFCNGKTCPECLTPSLSRSHRRMLDWLLHPFGYFPVRCRNCRDRFYAPRTAKQITHSHA